MTTTTLTTIDTIEDLTRSFARERNTLADRIGELESELLTVKRRKLRGIRSALARTQDAQSALESAIAGAPHLFTSPRTITIDGIRVGITKGKGKIQWDDEQKVCKLIEKHLPELAETLVKVTRKPIRSALASLTTAQLKRIGCRVEETGDAVLIKAQDSELDKLIGRILDETATLTEE